MNRVRCAVVAVGLLALSMGCLGACGNNDAADSLFDPANPAGGQAGASGAANHDAGAAGLGAGGAAGHGGSGASAGAAGAGASAGHAGTGGSGAWGGSAGASGSAGAAGAAGAGGFGAGGTAGAAGAGGATGSVQVSCGPQTGSPTCSVPDQACCISYRQNLRAGQCVDASSTANCNQGSWVECSAPSDCPSGRVCCGRRVDWGSRETRYSEITCAVDCSQDIVFCEPSQAGRSCSGGRGTCEPSSILPEGFYVCSQ